MSKNQSARIELTENQNDDSRLGRGMTESVSYTHLTLPTILRV